VVGHLTRAGALSWTPLHDGLGSGISDVAAGLGPGPGGGPVWLSGGLLTRAGGDAAIWSRAGARAAVTGPRGAPSGPAITAAGGSSRSARAVLLRRRG
jgi:hypothetical protein